MYYVPFYHYQSPYPTNTIVYQVAGQPVYGHVPVVVTYPTTQNGGVPLKDYGPNPFVININEASKRNQNYRTALWTGKHLQVTLMSINVGEDIGLEVHPNVDQFLRIEQGQGIVQMGSSKEYLTYQVNVTDDSAIMVPAGTWHNVTNTGSIPLKLYSIYAPPNHPPGTVDVTKAEAEEREARSGDWFKNLVRSGQNNRVLVKMLPIIKGSAIPISAPFIVRAFT